MWHQRFSVRLTNVIMGFEYFLVVLWAFSSFEDFRCWCGLLYIKSSRNTRGHTSVPLLPEFCLYESTPHTDLLKPVPAHRHSPLFANPGKFQWLRNKNTKQTDEGTILAPSNYWLNVAAAANPRREPTCRTMHRFKVQRRWKSAASCCIQIWTVACKWHL